MTSWYLILIMFGYSGEIAVIDFATEATCEAAIVELNLGMGSKAVCVENGL